MPVFISSIFIFDSLIFHLQRIWVIDWTVFHHFRWVEMKKSFPTVLFSNKNIRMKNKVFCFREEMLVFSIDSSARDFIDASNDFCFTWINLRNKKRKVVTMRFSVEHRTAPISSNLSFYLSCRQKKWSIGLLSCLFSERIRRRNEYFFFFLSIERRKMKSINERRDFHRSLSHLSVSRVVEKNQLSQRENHFNETFWTDENFFLFITENKTDFSSNKIQLSSLVAPLG